MSEYSTSLLRDYQREALSALREHFARGKKKCLVVAPTGSGKSFLIGSIALARAKNKGHRTLVLCHQAEILLQNEAVIHRLDPSIQTSVYCAGLARKEIAGDIVFASRDSLANNPLACGSFNLLIVDEAHLISPKDGSNYQKIFEAISAEYLVGFTGSPWRLDIGYIAGKDKPFDACAYSIPMRLLIDRGYLADFDFVSDTVIKTDKIDLVGGEFNNGQLTEISSTDKVVSECIEKWSQCSAKHSIFFCCSIAHAEIVTTHLRARGIRTAYIDGTTDSLERKTLFSKIRAGEYEAIVNVNVLTTGVDFPLIDCVVMLRATRSASLWVQAIGRGLRPHPGKTKCMILELTDNLARFESLEEPTIHFSKKKKAPAKVLGPGNAFQKSCPSCEEKNHGASTVCYNCEHIFISHGTELAKKAKWHAVASYNIKHVMIKNKEPAAIIFFQLKKGGVCQFWVMHKRRWAYKHVRIYKKIIGLGHISEIKSKDPFKKYAEVTDVR